MHGLEVITKNDARACIAPRSHLRADKLSCSAFCRVRVLRWPRTIRATMMKSCQIDLTSRSGAKLVKQVHVKGSLTRRVVLQSSAHCWWAHTRAMRASRPSQSAACGTHSHAGRCLIVALVVAQSAVQAAVARQLQQASSPSGQSLLCSAPGCGMQRAARHIKCFAPWILACSEAQLYCESPEQTDTVLPVMWPATLLLAGALGDLLLEPACATWCKFRDRLSLSEPTFAVPSLVLRGNMTSEPSRPAACDGRVPASTLGMQDGNQQGSYAVFNNWPRRSCFSVATTFSLV